VAATELASARMNGYFAGLETDADAIVGLAREAYTTAPSYRTRNVLIFAYLFRAGRRLEQTQPAYARMVERTPLSAMDSDLIAVALHGESPLREAARQNPDVRQAVDLIREAYRENPDHEVVTWTWSLLCPIDPDEGVRMAQTYLKSESAQISRAIQKRVEPASASAAMSLYWAAEMVGQNADGRAILEAYAARGVPLPIETP
jgi:hypothetical protein